MFKDSFKYFLKNSPLIHRLSVGILFLYLKLSYMTCRWEFIYPKEMDEDYVHKKSGTFFAIWHNRLAFAMHFGLHVYKDYSDISALASAHTDGKLITDIIKKMGYNVIIGSTNRNSMAAVRSIIKEITAGNKVVITPDGPRGPVYKINSNITRIAYKYNKPIIPVSCAALAYFELKSWDKMMIPKLFSKVVVTVGTPLALTGDEQIDNQLLEDRLMELTAKAKRMVG